MIDICSGLLPYERWSWDLSPAGSDSKLSFDPFSYSTSFYSHLMQSPQRLLKLPDPVERCLLRILCYNQLIISINIKHLLYAIDCSGFKMNKGEHNGHGPYSQVILVEIR